MSFIHYPVESNAPVPLFRCFYCTNPQEGKRRQRETKEKRVKVCNNIGLTRQAHEYNHDYYLLTGCGASMGGVDCFVRNVWRDLRIEDESGVDNKQL